MGLCGEPRLLVEYVEGLTSTKPLCKRSHGPTGLTLRQKFYFGKYGKSVIEI